MKHKKKKKMLGFHPHHHPLHVGRPCLALLQKKSRTRVTLRLELPSQNHVSTSSNEKTGGKGTLALKVLRRKVLKPTPAEHLFFFH